MGAKDLKTMIDWSKDVTLLDLIDEMKSAYSARASKAVEELVQAFGRYRYSDKEEQRHLATDLATLELDAIALLADETEKHGSPQAAIEVAGEAYTTIGPIREFYRNASGFDLLTFSDQ
jgi:hypothetical protein